MKIIYIKGLLLITAIVICLIEIFLIGKEPAAGLLVIPEFMIVAVYYCIKDK